MKVKRNADGLRRNAQKRREETFEKVDKGIQKLIKENDQSTLIQLLEPLVCLRLGFIRSRMLKSASISFGARAVLRAKRQGLFRLLRLHYES